VTEINDVYPSSKDLKLFFLVGKSTEISCFESAFEGLVHHRRTADPDTVHFFGIEFAHLLENKLFIPTTRVDLLLRQSQVELEVNELLSFTVSLQGFKQLQCHTLLSRWEGDIEDELECLEVENLSRIVDDEVS